ncbi:MAG: enoyl-CoA hydratase/isomerase family protein, partial [Myxococcales bacterium]|nr:enoyl-CoA hydratase/isomerase family protein [Myxococcales bacterium]
MEYQQILYKVDDPIATITLNRPKSLNAWTPQMGVEVKHAFAQAEADPAVVVIVLTGAGRGFCAGADLKGLSNLSEGGSILPYFDRRALGEITPAMLREWWGIE